MKYYLWIYIFYFSSSFHQLTYIQAYFIISILYANIHRILLFIFFINIWNLIVFRCYFWDIKGFEYSFNSILTIFRQKQFIWITPVKYVKHRQVWTFILRLHSYYNSLNSSKFKKKGSIYHYNSNWRQIIQGEIRKT